MTIDHNKSLTRKIRTLVIANSIYNGSGIPISPHSDPTDDVFEVVTIEDIGRLKSFRLLNQFYKGRHIQTPDICKEYRAKTLSVSSPVPTKIEIDGEFVGFLPLGAIIRPKVLEMMLP